MRRSKRTVHTALPVDMSDVNRRVWGGKRGTRARMGMIWGSANGGILAVLVAVISISDAQGGSVLEDGVGIGHSLEVTRGIHAIDGGGGDEGGEVEECEQKKETSVDRHNVRGVIQTSGRDDAVRRGRTGLGERVVEERAPLNRQRGENGIRR